MKRTIAILAPALLLAAAPAFAGDRCTASTQECLDYMVEHYGSRGWLGIEADYDEQHRLVIARVLPGSPAEEAALQPGDTLAGVNGIEYVPENEERLKEVKARMLPGTEFTFTIERDGTRRDLEVTLARMPEDVFATIVGRHMMEHADAEIPGGSE